MPVCGNYLFFELPKKIVLNPKDGLSRVFGLFLYACAGGRAKKYGDSEEIGN